MSLSTDYALRTGAYDHTGTAPKDIEAAKACLQQHRQARLYGSRINAGVVGAVAWCKSWFVQPSV